MSKLNHRSQPYKSWYRLDNAAVIFSLITSRKLPAVFRLSAMLQKPIHVDRLQKALELTLDRFPYFQVQLKKGMFWYHLAHNPKEPKIEPEVQDPCPYIPIYEDKTLPFRVRAYDCRIIVEFHHAITDGTGARKFLFSLITQYLELSGIEIDAPEIMRPGQVVKPEEYEDAFKRYYERQIPHLPRYSQAFQLPFPKDPDGRFYITQGNIKIDEIKQVTTRYEVTITELLVAIYIDSLQNVYYNLPKETQKQLARPIRVSVAINLRNIFPSETLRNFSLHVVSGIDPRLGKYTFDEIVFIVYHNLRVDINKKDLLRQIKRNVRGEMHPLMRGTPVFLKNMFGEYIYSIFGERQFSGSLSNLGYIDPDGDLDKHITGFELVPSRNNIRKVNCGITGFDDSLTITFGNTSINRSIERIYFRKLQQFGIQVVITTNYD